MIHRQFHALVILVIIAIGLCALQYSMSYNAVMTGPHIEYKIISFESIENHYEGYKHLPASSMAVWRIRFLSHVASFLYFKCADPMGKYLTNLNSFASCCAGYNMMWLMSCFILIILFAKKPLLWLFGYGVAMCYAWTPLGTGLILDWDGPSIFVWTLAMFFCGSKYKWVFFSIVAVGLGFKETIIVASIIPLFWTDRPIFERIKFVALMGVTCLVIKCGLSYFVGNPSIWVSEELHFPAMPRTGHFWFWDNNLHLLFAQRINGPIFACSGVILCLFLLPNSLKMVMCKVLASGFLLGLLIFGVFSECREFQDMIPVFFVGFESILINPKYKKFTESLI
jgi:hypothetical protein